REGSAADLDAVRRASETAGARVLVVTADLSVRADAERLAALALDRFGRVDVLVDNASALGPTPLPLLADIAVEAWVEVLRTNLTGPFLLTRALLGQMLAQERGAIIN